MKLLLNLLQDFMKNYSSNEKANVRNSCPKKYSCDELRMEPFPYVS